MEVFSVVGEMRDSFEEGRAVQAGVECALKHFQLSTLGEARRGGGLVRVSRPWRDKSIGEIYVPLTARGHWGGEADDCHAINRKRERAGGEDAVEDGLD